MAKKSGSIDSKIADAEKDYDRAKKKAEETIDEDAFFELLLLKQKEELAGLRLRLLHAAKELEFSEKDAWGLMAADSPILEDAEDALDLHYRSTELRAINRLISSIQASRWCDSLRAGLDEEVEELESVDEEERLIDISDDITAEELLNRLKRGDAQHILDMKAVMQGLFKGVMERNKELHIPTWVMAAEFDMIARSLASDFIHGSPPGLWGLAEEVLELIRAENEQKAKKMFDEY